MIVINGRYTNAAVYCDNISESAYKQLHRLCDHPMFGAAVIKVMPDCHAGKGCVIGFTSISSEKIIVPNLVGVDIGCGVLTTLFDTETLPDFHALDRFIRDNIPSGMDIRETPCSLMSETGRLRESVEYICRIIHKEDRFDTFLNSMGTLGGGNHFIEIDRVSENRYMLAVHTGSRSLGNYICRYFQSKGSLIDERMKRMLVEKHRAARSAEEHRLIQQEIENLPKVEADAAYITGALYDSYIECMLLAEEYAAENRRCISEEIMKYLIGAENVRINESFDTVHNFVDWYDPEHTSVVIRKGAISAESGQKLCIPLNMRDGIIVGTGKGNDEWNRSAPHGAGRVMSRSAARSSLSLEEYEKSMEGVSTWSVNESTIDEAPWVYKPPEEIIGNISETVDIDFIAETLYNFKA